MFGHETISPNNIQANGVAEAVVKIMKWLWHKCRASSEGSPHRIVEHKEITN